MALYVMLFILKGSQLDDNECVFESGDDNLSKADSSITMTDKFEKMVRCQHCQGFLPYVRGQQQLSVIDLLDCKRHIPSKLVLSETYQKDRLTPKKGHFLEG